MADTNNEADDISEIDYCSGRYNDDDEFNSFANCIRTRL